MKKIAFHLILLTIFTIGCNSKTSNSFDKTKTTVEKKEVSTHPKRVNQKFITSFGDGDTLTVKSFHGGTGVEYPTYEEAEWKNGDDKMLLIKNVEHGGASEWKESYLVGNNILEEEFSPLHENYKLNQTLLKSVWESIKNKDFQKLIEKGSSKNLIKLETLEEIGKLVDSKPKVSWKLNMKRIDKELVKYNLFAYPPRFYGDPVFPPFLEIETSVDNSKDPNKLNSFNVKLEDEIDLDKIEEIGINPKHIN